MSKNILITGASSGFGRGSAIELARAGHTVVATAETWPQVRRLRADAALAGTRLVALSGYAQPEDRERSRASGFDDHLAKPVDPQVVLAMLARL